MERFLGRVILSLSLCLLLAATGHARELKKVYLKGDGIIECQKVWQEGNKVKVLVNRDTFLEFSKDEVDLKRTFKPHKRVKPRKVSSGKSAAATPTAQPAAPAPAVPQAGQVAKIAPVATVAVPQKTMTSARARGAGAVAKPAAGGPKEEAKVSPQPKSEPAATQPPVPVRKTLPQKTLPPPAVHDTAAMAGMLGIETLLPFLLIIVILIASLWRVFSKAGEAGWQCLIPLYNMYVLVKISGKPWWWFLLLFIPVVNIIIGVLVQIALAERFGRGVLYGLGLAFLGFVFYPVLAFGNAEYR